MEKIQIDRTDEEREELVKQWIKDYWVVVVLAIVLALGAVWGLNYFKKSKTEGLSHLAVQTNAVNTLLKKGDMSAAKAKVVTLQTKEPDSTFSALATLSLAQKYFVEKRYDDAISQYDWLVLKSSDIGMRDVARLRKARALAETNKIKAAVTTLDELEGGAFIAESDLLRGDLFLANKQFDKAQKAYEKLLKNPAVNQGLVNQRLELVGIQKQIQ